MRGIPLCTDDNTGTGISFSCSDWLNCHQKCHLRKQRMHLIPGWQANGKFESMHNLGTDRFRWVRWVVNWVRLLPLCLSHPPSEDCEDTTRVGGGTVSGPE